MKPWLQCSEYKVALGRQLLSPDSIDVELNRVADQYEAKVRVQVLNILKKITRYEEGTIHFAGDQILVQEFAVRHHTFHLNPTRTERRLPISQLWEFLSRPIEVKPGGRSTRSGPATSDHSRTESDYYRGRYGIWAEVRERMDEEGRIT